MAQVAIRRRRPLDLTDQKLLLPPRHALGLRLRGGGGQQQLLGDLVGHGIQREEQERLLDGGKEMGAKAERGWRGCT